LTAIIVLLSIGCTDQSERKIDTGPPKTVSEPLRTDSALRIVDSEQPKIVNDRLAEGVYATPDEISGFSGTTLELKDGGFRYWFHSDVGGLNEPEYPIIGKYEFQNGVVLLNSTQVNQSQWFIDVVHGTPVLWREDALKIWKRDRKIYDYGVLVWSENDIQDDDLNKLQRRSVRDLYSEEKKNEIKEWKDPFVHGAQ
jgi:hypothetical protein